MFCNCNHVCNLFPVNCLPLCSSAKLSYVSYDNKYETLIEFVCVPLEVHDIVTKCEIVDDHCLNVSRHTHVYVQFVVERVSLQNQCYDDDSDIKLACINWSMVTHSQIECFSADVESECVLGGIAERKLSNNDIDDTYHMLTKPLHDCAQKHCPKKRFAKFLKPYWNEDLIITRLLPVRGICGLMRGDQSAGRSIIVIKMLNASFDGSIGIIRHDICYPLTMNLTVLLSQTR